MNAPALKPSPEQLHPSLWRASQLAHSVGRCIDTGYQALSHQLSGGGWPVGTLVDLLVAQPGIGEMRLLSPALRTVARKRVILLQPPHTPQAIALANMGLAPSQIVWLKSESSADALWAAEQVLRGGCGALLFWTKHIRADSLRRLHLAAQSGESLFFALRPLAAAQDASPAPLRLSLRPAPEGGIAIEFTKRRGPQRDEPLMIPLGGYDNIGVRRHGVGSRPAAAPAHQAEVAPGSPEFALE